MSKAPFKNIYDCKHVQPNAAKACIICYKSTETVLITLERNDWFYVCEVHLKDKQFAELVYASNDGVDTRSQWVKYCAEVEKAQTELQKYKRKTAEQSKDGWFDKIHGIWKTSDPKVDDESNSSEQEKESFETIEENVNRAQAELKSFEKTNIKYKLDTIFYKKRLMEDYQKKKQRETMKKMQEGSLFPNTEELNQLP